MYILKKSDGSNVYKIKLISRIIIKKLIKNLIKDTVGNLADLLENIIENNEVILSVFSSLT